MANKPLVKQAHPEYTPTEPALDFCGDMFDAAKALAADNVTLPYPQVKAVDNLSVCYYKMFAKKERDAHNAIRQQKAAQEAEKFKVNQAAHPAERLAEEARKKAEEAKAAGLEKKAKKKRRGHMNVLERMEEAPNGPLSVLHKCCKNKSKVWVVTRRDTAVRGTCTGTLEAYDEHFNLVLRDVEESFSEMALQRPSDHSTTSEHHATSGHSASRNDPSSMAMVDSSATEKPKPRRRAQRARAKATRLVYKEVHGTRKVAQLFVRGDNVVLVHEL